MKVYVSPSLANTPAPGEREMCATNHLVGDDAVDQFAARGNRRLTVLIVFLAIPGGVPAMWRQYGVVRHHQLIFARGNQKAGVTGRVADRREEPDAGATSALSSTSFQFFHVGKTSAMRLPAALRPSANFSTRPGSVHHLYSEPLTMSSALGKTAALVPFSINPQT